jgi:hypothetical protein
MLFYYELFKKYSLKYEKFKKNNILHNFSELLINYKNSKFIIYKFYLLYMQSYFLH